MQEKGDLGQIPDGARVRACLSSKTIEVDKSEQERCWNGKYLDFSFQAYVPENYCRKTMRFVAKVYVDGVRVSKISFTVKCQAQGVQCPRVRRFDVNSIFVSYSRKVLSVVSLCLESLRKGNPNLEIIWDLKVLELGKR